LDVDQNSPSESDDIEMTNQPSAAGFGSPDRLEIPSTTAIVAATDFRAHISIAEVVVASNRCRTIDGFSGFRSLSRIVIPSSVEVIE
jgi:hypothetical protein